MAYPEVMGVRTLQFVWAATLVCVLGVTPVAGELKEFPLQEFVKRAEYIVIGEVVTLKKTKKKKRFAGVMVPLYMADIEVEQTIKGDPSVRHLVIDYRLHPEQPQFQMGRVLVFVAPYTVKRWVVQGLHGLLPIHRVPMTANAHTIGPIYILGEAERQNLEEFLERIKVIMEEAE